MALTYGNRPIVTNGLVLCLDAANRKSYPGSGTTWTDLSGNGNNGTLINGVGYDSGNGGSLTFDGVDDYGSLSYSSLLNLGTQFTICGFVKLNDLSTRNYIIGAADVQTSVYTEGYMFYLRTDPTFGLNANTLVLQFGQSNWAWNVYGSNGITITDTNWHFVSVSASNLNTNSPTINFYNDNNSVLGTYWTSGAPKNPIRYSSNLDSIRVSSLYYPSNPSYGGGFGNNNVSNVSIYNRALTAAEIQQNYNANKSRYL